MNRKEILDKFIYNNFFMIMGLILGCLFFYIGSQKESVVAYLVSIIFFVVFIIIQLVLNIDELNNNLKK